MNYKKLLFLILLLTFAVYPFHVEAAPSGATKSAGVSFSPTGTVSNNVAFKATFTDPMVSRKDIGKILSVADFPFTITPALQAEGKWIDHRTFSISLLKPLDMGTVYNAALKENLKNAKGRQVRSQEKFTFQTDPLRVLSVRAARTRNGEVEIRMEFNMPVPPSRLRGFMHIVQANGGSIAYRISNNTPSETVLANIYIGELYDTLKLSVRFAAGLTGATGTLGLLSDEAHMLEIKPVLRVENMTPSNSDIRVYTNLAIDLDRADDFIKIEPSVPFTLDSYYSGMFFIRGNFEPRGRFAVTLKKGFPARDSGLVLDEDYTQAVIMPDLPPSIQLPATGTFLSPVGGGKIPVQLVNISKLNISLWRLYENNLPYMMRGNYNYFERELGRRVYNKVMDLSLPLNQNVRRAIPLDDVLSGDRGLFLLTLSNPDYEYWYERSQIVNLSDMGAVVRLWEDGVLVWVNTLSGIQPVEDAVVRVYSRANQLLAEGRTGPDGVWLHRNESPWSKDEDLLPSLATVSKGRDVAFVQLTRGLLSQEIFDTAGRPWLRAGYDAMLFSPRDIYRTGEQVPFKAVVRTYDLQLPGSFPVLFVIRDPLGRTVQRGTGLLGEEGGALYTLDLPGNALTGNWEASLYIPGDESRPLARMGFSVEDFAPPRIEVKIAAEAKRLSHGENTGFDLSAKYLFGVDGAGLRWDALWRASEGRFSPQNEKWKPYAFGDPERRFLYRSEEITSGNLDDQGKIRFGFQPGDDWQASSVIDVTVVGRVMEEGGRWVTDGVTLPYFPTPWLLGLAAPEGELAVNNDIRFRVAAVTPDEAPADPGELTASFYRVTWNYNLVEIDGYTRWQSSEEYTKVDTKNFTVTDGMGEISFKPNRWGTYVVQVSDSEDDARTSFRFYANDPQYAERGGSQLLDRVEIALDKEIYKVGDTAKVTLRAPFEGLLLFSVEGMELLDRRVLKIEQAETVVEIPVTDKMMPNAWCSAWLLRPVAEEENWSTHRAAGVKSLKVDTSAFRLDVKLEAPDKQIPATNLPVRITLLDHEGKPAQGEIALSLVDDGVLGLTNFKTPDLLGYFLGLRQMNSNGYDLYDLLMPLESRSTELLHPGGGAAMKAFAGASSKPQRFKILSLFEGTVSADADGIAKLDLELPEFSGRGRLAAVATSGSRFGKAEKNIQIARDIVTEADLPRFAAPGDTFKVPLTVYNSSEMSKDVAIELKTLGELSIESEAFLKDSVPAKGSRKWDVEIKADVPGSATYVVRTSWQSEGLENSFVQSIDLPIRSPFPVVTLSNSGFFASGDTKIEIPRDSFAGPVVGGLTLTDTPFVDLSKATAFLTHYPYGCLEQTLSAAWPFIVLPDALAEIDPLLVDAASVKRKTDYALARIQAMQLYDGSFGRWPGDGYPYNWGSVYATHFLVEARKIGLDYPEDLYKGALNWMKQFLASLPVGKSTYAYRERDDLTTKAYASYVLALAGEKPLGWLTYLGEHQDKMWPSGRIWLAGAYALIEGKADALRNLGSWGGNDIIASEALYETLDSNVRNTAQLLSLWTEVEPKAPEALHLVEMLLKWGKENRWYSTQENATVTMALGRYLIKNGYEKAELEGALKDDDGQAILSYRSSQKANRDINDLPEGSWTLDILGTGKGYYAWNVRGTPTKAPAPERKGLTLNAVWTDRSGNGIDREQPLAQGSEILVTLSLTPTLPVSNLVVSYLLPAGFEIDNPRLKDNENQETFGVRYDVRDDRLLLYIDLLSIRTDYRFVMRAVTRGNFVTPPLAAEGMYDPQIHFVGAEEKNITIE